MKKKLLTALILALVTLSTTLLFACNTTSVKKHSVTFISEGETYLSQRVPDGELIEVPTPPEKADYVFTGWFLDEEYSVEYTFTDPVSADTTLYAKFELAFIDYSVTFISEGATYLSQTVREGNLAEVPVQPQKEGYVFKGWFLDEAFTVEYGFTDPVNANTTLYAKFTVGYSVSFFVGEELFASQFIAEGDSATYPEIPKADGFVFKKWCIDQGLSFEFDFANPIFEETVIYAQMAEAYKVNYSDEEGNIIFSENVEKGTAPTEPAPPEKEGYKLKDWYLDKDLTIKYDFDTPLEEGTILYPLYEKIIVIYTANALRQITDKPDGFYKLGADINLAGEQWTPIENFSGELDGNGKKIKHFTIKSEDFVCGFIKKHTGTIKNVEFESVTIWQKALANEDINTRSNVTTGTVAAFNYGRIENCHLSLTVINVNIEKFFWKINYHDIIGGIVGKNTGIIDKSSFSGEINFNLISIDGGQKDSYLNHTCDIGGLSGINEKGSCINDCESNLSVSTNTDLRGWYRFTNAWIQISGGVGTNYGTIKNCASEYTVTSQDISHDQSKSSYLWGGIVSINKEEGEVYSSFAEGKITASGNIDSYAVGGFVAENRGIIYNCYSILDSNDNTLEVFLGGFCGTNLAVIRNCFAFATIKTVNIGYYGGFVGHNASTGEIISSLCDVNLEYTQNSNGANKIESFVGESVFGSFVSQSYFTTDAVNIFNNEQVEITNSLSTVSYTNRENLYSSEFLIEQLRWDATIWVVDGVNLPRLIWEPEENKHPIPPVVDDEQEDDSTESEKGSDEAEESL